MPRLSKSLNFIHLTYKYGLCLAFNRSTLSWAMSMGEGKLCRPPLPSTFHWSEGNFGKWRMGISSMSERIRQRKFTFTWCYRVPSMVSRVLYVYFFCSFPTILKGRCYYCYLIRWEKMWHKNTVSFAKSQAFGKRFQIESPLAQYRRLAIWRKSLKNNYLTLFSLI